MIGGGGGADAEEAGRAAGLAPPSPEQPRAVPEAGAGPRAGNLAPASRPSADRGRRAQGADQEVRSCNYLKCSSNIFRTAALSRIIHFSYQFRQTDIWSLLSAAVQQKPVLPPEQRPEPGLQVGDGLPAE